MNDRQLIAEALLEIAKERSTTTLLSETTYSDELMVAAEKVGIVLPSPDFAVFETVYAEIDKPNQNGVILPRKAVEEGLPTLIGKQCNWEHAGAGQLCGFTIAASVDGDKIKTINVIWKSLFTDKMEEVEKKFKEGKFSVSFEIWTKDIDGQSVVTKNEDGTKSINKIIFHGTGVLLTHEPACKKAIVYRLVAKKNEEKIFDDTLVYASLAIGSKCDTCKTCKKEEQKLEEIQKTAEEIAAEEIAKKKKICAECNEEMEPDCEDEICAKCKEKKVKAEEILVVPEVPAIKAEETVVPDVLVVTPVEPVIPLAEKAEAVEVPVEKTEVNRLIEERRIVKTTVSYSDGTSDISIQDMDVIDFYTKAQVDEAIANTKKEIEDAKNQEIATLKAEQDTKIAELKAEKEKELAALTIVKAEEKPEGKTDLTVGDVTGDDGEHEGVRIRKEVDARIKARKESNKRKK